MSHFLAYPRFIVRAVVGYYILEMHLLLFEMEDTIFFFLVICCASRPEYVKQQKSTWTKISSENTLIF